MDAVLCIDAAWTENRASGVALVEESGGRWTCVGVAPSYEAFLGLPRGVKLDWESTFRGSEPNPGALLEAAKHLLIGKAVSVVTVDMPVSLRPIDGRREADNAITKDFSKQHCGTHTPNRDRPGRIGEQLRKGFEDEHYPVAVKGESDSTSRRLVEVYPHPAPLVLLKTNHRIPYKVAKAGKYWKGVPLEMIMYFHGERLSPYQPSAPELPSGSALLVRHFQALVLRSEAKWELIRRCITVRAPRPAGRPYAPG
jgi:hypothetical protein